MQCVQTINEKEKECKREKKAGKVNLMDNIFLRLLSRYIGKPKIIKKITWIELIEKRFFYKSN